MIVAVNDLPKFQKEKAGALFYRMIRRRLLRKWLGGRMIRSQEHHMLKIDRTGSRSKGKGNENPSELSELRD